ncbi:MAG: hypothetical protein M1831_001993 [Alyxoria varia]|nr:MAG: hypothetical protein M1831_001993 [Alyxoria varia]
MVSASPTPRTILLLDTTSEVGAVPIKPRNSDAPVSTAAFHPGNQDTFVLGFLNGTLSVHSCSRIVLGRDKRSEGLLGCYQRLHQQSLKRNNIVSKHSALGVTSAAFLGSHKARIVSIGIDRTCKIVDFEKRPQILCTWSLGAFGTTLAVLPSSSTAHILERDGAASMNGVTYDSHTSGSDDDLIAIAKSNGHVTVYSAIGVVQQEIRASRNTRRIIDLDWVRNPSPYHDDYSMREHSSLRALPEQQHHVTKSQDGLLQFLQSTRGNKFSTIMQGLSFRAKRTPEGEQKPSESLLSNETPRTFFPAPGRQHGTEVNNTGLDRSDETTDTVVITRNSEKQQRQSPDWTKASASSSKLPEPAIRPFWQRNRTNSRDEELLHIDSKAQKPVTIHTENSPLAVSRKESSAKDKARSPKVSVHQPADQRVDHSTSLRSWSRHARGSSSQSQPRTMAAPSYQQDTFIRPKISLSSFQPPPTAGSSGAVRTVQDIITRPSDSAHGGSGASWRSREDGTVFNPSQRLPPLPAAKGSSNFQTLWRHETDKEGRPGNTQKVQAKNRACEISAKEQHARDHSSSKDDFHDVRECKDDDMAISHPPQARPECDASKVVDKEREAQPGTEEVLRPLHPCHDHCCCHGGHTLELCPAFISLKNEVAALSAEVARAFPKPQQYPVEPPPPLRINRSGNAPRENEPEPNKLDRRDAPNDSTVDAGLSENQGDSSTRENKFRYNHSYGDTLRGQGTDVIDWSPGRSGGSGSSGTGSGSDPGPHGANVNGLGQTFGYGTPGSFPVADYVRTPGAFPTESNVVHHRVSSSGSGALDAVGDGRRNFTFPSRKRGEHFAMQRVPAGSGTSTREPGRGRRRSKREAGWRGSVLSVDDKEHDGDGKDLDAQRMVGGTESEVNRGRGVSGVGRRGGVGGSRRVSAGAGGVRVKKRRWIRVGRFVVGMGDAVRSSTTS